MIIDLGKVWTVRELMMLAIRRLGESGIEDARLNVELILAHVLKYQRIELYMNFDRYLTLDETKAFNELFLRRLKREPLQYILGSTNFMGLNFLVSPDVFIPRPETETLVEQAILFSQKYPDDELIHILDIGTGCGNIAISLAKFIKNSYVTSFDNNFKALDVAKKNAEMHHVESKVCFFYADIFDENEELLKNKYDLIVSNPPYIPGDEWNKLQEEVRCFEPSSALTDGADGLSFYKRIADLSSSILRGGGGVILEIGFGQAKAVAEFLEKVGLERLQIVADLQGIPRVVFGTKLILPENYISLN